jgi:Protein of unknown function (DUF2510)
MGAEDEQATTSPQDPTSIPPPGWYPNPQGAWGLRWWDGARWSDQVAAPTTPPRKDAASQQLNIAFGVEVPCALLSFGLAWLSLFGVAGCYGTLGSDPQCQVWGGRGWCWSPPTWHCWLLVGRCLWSGFGRSGLRSSAGL